MSARGGALNLTDAQREARWQAVSRMRRDGVTFAAIAAALGVELATAAAWYRTEAARRRTNQTLATSLARCLRCRGEFPSEGAHNRMCRVCRGLSVSPLEPDPGGDTGRRVGRAR